MDNKSFDKKPSKSLIIVPVNNFQKNKKYVSKNKIEKGDFPITTKKFLLEFYQLRGP